jgi:E3 ubiquitin-protein ligase SHPRH
MGSIVTGQDPVAWLEGPNDSESLEADLLRLFQVVSGGDHDDERPKKRQRLENDDPASLTPLVDRIVLKSTTIRVNSPTDANSPVWSAIASIADRSLPINISEPSSEPDPSNVDRLAAKIELYDICNGNVSIGSLQIHNLSEAAFSVLRLSYKAQQQWKRSLRTYQDFTNGFVQMVVMSEAYITRGSEVGEFILDFRLTWENGKSCFDAPKMAMKRTTEVFDECTKSDADSWSPQDFYENVHTPSPDQVIWSELDNDFLNCSLYPFQKRTVQYMLAREGVEIRDGAIVTKDQSSSSPSELPVSFQCMGPSTSSGQKPNDSCYISRTFGKIFNTKTDLPNIVAPRGGILAEEMGLGKTVELIALMSLHRRDFSTGQDVIQGRSSASKGEAMILDEYSNKKVIASGATLIITPPHLVQQWEDELTLHAPGLRVCYYGGVASLGKRTTQELAEYDVVLTTYAVIGREIWYADAQPKKNLRHERKYSPPSSALVEIGWWRVCLDEAQMVESAITNSAIVARLIPRINAWAVSGTPFKNHVTDLLGLLTFLRFEPFSDRKIWSRVDKPTFKQIFSTIAIRHTKDKVRHELQLPVQKRFVITIPFLAIEEQHYARIFEDMCTDCGFNQDGTPKTDDFENYAQLRIEKMRAWLRRLRQLCLHPQVGGKNRRALGTGKDVPLRTVDEVLKVMIDQNDNLLRSAERDVVLAQINQGHVHAFDGSRKDRSLQSLTYYTSALDLIVPIVSECRVAYRALVPSGAARNTESSSDAEDDVNALSEKTREQQQKAVNFRKALELHHMASFFVGTAHYQIKENEDLTPKDSDEFARLETLEAQFYDAAKAIRLEILKDPREKVENSMKATKALQHRSLEPFEMPDHSGGIENIKIMDKLQATADKLNEQIALISEWRSRVHKILLKPLVDNDDQEEQTGEEYEDSTKEQDELYVLFLVLRTFAADRATYITGYVNPLVEHEAKQALKQAKKPEHEGRGPAPEIMIECLQHWQRLRPGEEAVSLRGVLADLRSLLTQLEWQLGQANVGISRTRITSEMSIVKNHMQYLQDTANSQSKAVQELEKELDQFRSCMNNRLAFYRELQRISDMVQPFKEQMDETFDSIAFTVWNSEETRAEKVLAGYRTKRRFFEHLRKESDQEAQRLCVICQSDFENGVLTVCGHQYCKFCITEWWAQHRTCPLCKRHLRLEDFHDITYKPREIQAKEENDSSLDKRRTSSSEDPNQPVSVETSIYSAISTESLNQIKSVDLPNSFGTKIDTLARHLIWLREVDPGAKSIIFSQFTEFLDVLSSALNTFKIGFASISRKGQIGKFRRDPSVECFLLDAKSDSSGLNLVNATHVFLCEPLVNPAIELQAIARVHRIGQMRSTTVWMSLIADTVEEAVYNLSVNRRLEHIAQQKRESHAVLNGSSRAQQQQNEIDIDAANSAELQSVPVSRLLLKGAKNSGELVDQRDLWTCLFSKTDSGTRVNESLRAEMDRHYRAEAAERRMEEGHASSSRL